MYRTPACSPGNQNETAREAAREYGPLLTRPSSLDPLLVSYNIPDLARGSTALAGAAAARRAAGAATLRTALRNIAASVCELASSGPVRVSPPGSPLVGAVFPQSFSEKTRFQT